MSIEMVLALSNVGIAAINMIGSVLILWIRARYKWTNGHGRRNGRSPIVSAASPP